MIGLAFEKIGTIEYATFLSRDCAGILIPCMCNARCINKKTKKVRDWSGVFRQGSLTHKDMITLSREESMKLTRQMEENLNAICAGCDQDELDKRSVNALIRRGLVLINDRGYYQATVKGEDAARI